MIGWKPSIAFGHRDERNDGLTPILALLFLMLWVAEGPKPRSIYGQSMNVVTLHAFLGIIPPFGGSCAHNIGVYELA